VRYIILAVLVGYTVNALLIAGAEQLLSMAFADRTWMRADVATQCVIQAVSGYLCSRMARDKERAATIGLIIVGLLVGTISVVRSWHAEAHWYAISLLIVYAPCVWIGHRMERRQHLTHALLLSESISREGAKDDPTRYNKGE